MKTPLVSAIIVDYDSAKLGDALAAQLQKIPECEVIRVDAKKQGLGYGAACNAGAQQASGSFFFFLNPDIVLHEGCVEALLARAQADPLLGVLGPQILTQSGELQESVSTVPGPLMYFILMSFLSKTNLGKQAHRKYRLNDFDQRSPRLVPCVAGCALFVRAQAYGKCGGFDENLFLYFEEFDFCSRVAQTGYAVWFESTAQLTHLGAQSTQTLGGQGKKHFLASRQYWLTKAYGWRGWCVHALLRLTERYR